MTDEQEKPEHLELPIHRSRAKRYRDKLKHNFDIFFKF